MLNDSNQTLITVIRICLNVTQSGNIIQNHLTNNNVDLTKDTELFNELNQHAVLSMTYGAYKNFEISENCRREWDRCILRLLANNIQVQHVENATAKILKEKEIDAVVIKGSISASYYCIPSLRTLGDVDILVLPEQFQKAADVLESNGYLRKTGNYEDPRNTTFEKNGFVVELHRHFFKEDRELFDSIIFDAFPEHIQKKVNNVFIPSLPDAINGLILLEHFRQHIDGDIGLRHLIDWQEYVRCICDNEFWNEKLKTLTDKTGLTKLAKTLTYICKKYFSLPESITWGDDCDNNMAEKIIEFVINNGNFGSKRRTDGELIVSVASYKTNLIGWLKYVQNAGVQHWRLAQRFIFVRPFAWLYQILRYLKNSVQSRACFDFIKNKGWYEVRNRKKMFKYLEL